MKRNFSALGDSRFDLLVCGGGIYGAWTAYDAALRGLKVALVEQGDWAGATSSASSKLIHGGLRYLESFDFKLVKKALAERELLMRLAPHRVWPLRFGVPVYQDSRLSRPQLMAGLTIYDLLAAEQKEMRYHYFDPHSFAERFQALNEAGLRGGFTYTDAQTDDARLVLELVAGAIEAGAVCVNRCRMEALLEAGNKVVGATLRDMLSEQQCELHAHALVQATGPWLSADKTTRDWCRLSKGTHLLLPAVLNEEALLLTAHSDGRVFFMIPWYGLTLVGTTDGDYHGDVTHIDVEQAEVDYLLREANHYLKTHWTTQDVIGSYSGVRAMRHSDAASPAAVSRDWELKTADNGVLYSIGGKITSARQDASLMVDAICAQLGVSAGSISKERRLPWAVADFSSWTEQFYARAQQLGIDNNCSLWLLRRHGKRADEILDEVENNAALATRIRPELPFIYADLYYCAANEMVVHLDDLLRRRMPLLIMATLQENELMAIAENVATILGWDEIRISQEVANCRRHS